MNASAPLPQLIDSHCHLDMTAYAEDLHEVLDAAAKNGISRIITIGIDRESSRAAVELARSHPGLFAAVGYHPHYAADADESGLQELIELASHPAVVGYGEIGLDYAKQYSPKEIQQDLFARQLELAKTLELPIIIHDRDAHEDTLAILREVGLPRSGGVMHCFSGDLDFAEQVLDLGMYISIPGIITFKNAASLRQVVEATALDNLLLETDGPFLAPVPFRGKRNTPAYLVHTAQAVAEIKNTTLAVVARQTTANTCKLFNLPLENP
ncbi:MAG: hydrolase TatD [Desulfobulbus propionicus]|nr:MAG: hydrolase TatD [Desulfobulbus propionicus]